MFKWLWTLKIKVGGKKLRVIKSYSFKCNLSAWTSWVAQWQRIRLPMQERWTGSLIREDPACCGTTKAGHRNCWAWALELGAAATEAPRPRASASQQEKPLQWEACVLELESTPCSPQLEKGLRSTEDPAQPKINKRIKLILKITIICLKKELSVLLLPVFHLSTSSGSSHFLEVSDSLYTFWGNVWIGKTEKSAVCKASFHVKTVHHEKADCSACISSNCTLP